MTPKRTALITGASAGIGQAFAEQLAARDYDLVLCARRQERLRQLGDKLQHAHRIQARVIACDLADPLSPSRIVEELAAESVHVDTLVNNAGFGLAGHYAKTRWEDQRAYLNLMVYAVAELTHRLLPAMVERGHGRIINVASLAGLVPGSRGNTLYSASKSFMIKMSESLALELDGSGVHVTAVCPGFTYSEFHDVSGTREKVSQLPKLLWMQADEVVRQALDASERGDAVYVNGAVNRAIAGFVRLLPPSAALGVMGRSSGRFRKEE